MNKIIYNYYLLLVLISTSLLNAQCPDGYVIKDSNLVFNGDFNLGNVGFTSDHNYSRTYHRLKPVDVLQGRYTITYNSRDLLDPFGDCFGPDGSHQPLMAGDTWRVQQDYWRQTVKVKPNTNYVYQAYVSSSCCLDVLSSFGFYAGDERLAIVDSRDTCIWDEFKMLWNSGNKNKISLSIQNIEIAGYGNDFLLDNISLKECVKPSPKVEKVIVKEKIDFDDKYYVYIDPKSQIRLQNVTFAKNATTLNTVSKQDLDEVVKHLNKFKKFHVDILVHNGIPEKTKIKERMLSQRRAVSIKNYLTQKGIKPDRMKAIGKGYDYPLRKDLRKESIQLNERVLVRFHQPKK